MPKNKILALKIKNPNQILTNNDEVCIRGLLSILLVVVKILKEVGTDCALA